MHAQIMHRSCLRHVVAAEGIDFCSKGSTHQNIQKGLNARMVCEMRLGYHEVIAGPLEGKKLEPEQIGSRPHPDGHIRMANLAFVGSHAVNGVEACISCHGESAQYSVYGLHGLEKPSVRPLGSAAADAAATLGVSGR